MRLPTPSSDASDRGPAPGSPGDEPGRADRAHADRGVVRDAAATVFGRVALAGLILATDVALARMLGPTAKGSFTLVLLFSQLGALVFGLGLDKALGVVAARSVATARRAFANVISWTLLIGGLGVVGSIWLYHGSGVVPSAAPGAGPLAALLPNLTPRHFLFGALALPAEMFLAMGLVGLLGRRRVVEYNGIRLIRRAVLLLLVLAAAALLRLDLETALVVNLVALATAAVAILAVMAREGVLGIGADPRLLAEQLRFGARSMPGTLAERLQFRADAFLLNLFVGIAATGVYSVAAGVAETLWYVPNALGLVMFSRAVAGDREDAGRIASRMTRVTLALTLALALPIGLLAPTLVPLVYGPEFVPAAPALQLLLPGVVAYSVVAILSQYIVGRGAPGTYTLTLLAGLVTNLALNMLLIPRFGIQGAAIASSVSYAVTAVLTLTIFWRLSGQGVRDTLVLGRGDVGRVVRVLAARPRAPLGRDETPRRLALGERGRGER